MDTVRNVIEKALDNKILVVKVDDRFYKNPSLSFVAKLFQQKLTAKFRMIIGPEQPDQQFRYMQELHGRAKSVHVDMRWTLGGDLVSGVTIACPFALPVADTWEQEIKKLAKEIAGVEIKKNEDWDNIKPLKKHAIREALHKKFDASFFVKPFVELYRPNFINWNKKHVFVPKAMQDTSWFEQEYIQIPPGFVGSTRYTWAVLAPFDKGILEFGVIKADYVELFLYSDNNFYNGKASLVYLPREQVESSLPFTDDEGKLGDELWVGFLFTTKSSLPYMLSERAIEEDYMPPTGISSLPKVIRERLPKEARYWETGEKTARDKAVEWARKNMEAYVRKDVSDIPSREDLWTF